MIIEMTSRRIPQNASNAKTPILILIVAQAIIKQFCRLGISIKIEKTDAAPEIWN